MQKINLGYVRGPLGPVGDYGVGVIPLTSSINNDATGRSLGEVLVNASPTDENVVCGGISLAAGRGCFVTAIVPNLVCSTPFDVTPVKISPQGEKVHTLTDGHYIARPSWSVNDFLINTTEVNLFVNDVTLVPGDMVRITAISPLTTTFIANFKGPDDNASSGFFYEEAAISLEEVSSHPYFLQGSYIEVGNKVVFGRGRVNAGTSVSVLNKSTGTVTIKGGLTNATWGYEGMAKAGNDQVVITRGLTMGTSIAVYTASTDSIQEIGLPGAEYGFWGLQNTTSIGEIVVIGCSVLENDHIYTYDSSTKRVVSHITRDSVMYADLGTDHINGLEFLWGPFFGNTIVPGTWGQMATVAKEGVGAILGNSLGFQVDAQEDPFYYPADLADYLGVPGGLAYYRASYLLVLFVPELPDRVRVMLMPGVEYNTILVNNYNAFAPSYAALGDGNMVGLAGLDLIEAHTGTKHFNPEVVEGALTSPGWTTRYTTFLFVAPIVAQYSPLYAGNPSADGSTLNNICVAKVTVNSSFRDGAPGVLFWNWAVPYTDPGKPWYESQQRPVLDNNQRVYNREFDNNTEDPVYSWRYKYYTESIARYPPGNVTENGRYVHEGFSGQSNVKLQLVGTVASNPTFSNSQYRTYADMSAKQIIGKNRTYIFASVPVINHYLGGRTSGILRISTQESVLPMDRMNPGYLITGAALKKFDTYDGVNNIVWGGLGSSGIAGNYAVFGSASVLTENDTMTSKIIVVDLTTDIMQYVDVGEVGDWGAQCTTVIGDKIVMGRGNSLGSNILIFDASNGTFRLEGAGVDAYWGQAQMITVGNKVIMGPGTTVASSGMLIYNADLDEVYYDIIDDTNPVPWGTGGLRHIYPGDNVGILSANTLDTRLAVIDESAAGALRLV